MPKNELAILIDTAIRKAGFATDYAAAQAIGMDAKSLARIRRGEVSPSIDTLEKIFHPIGWEVAVSFFPAKKSR
jgi:transcriptional regulator with XRE-family HTH domain